MVGHGQGFTLPVGEGDSTRSSTPLCKIFTFSEKTACFGALLCTLFSYRLTDAVSRLNRPDRTIYIPQLGYTTDLNS